MLELVNTPPHKIIFLGPGCSVATTPVAEAAPYWQAVQVSLQIYLCLRPDSPPYSPRSLI